jgi:WD40 repeat protein
LTCGTSHGNIYIWSVLEDGTIVTEVRQKLSSAHEGAISALSWSPKGQTLASASEDGFIKLWAPTTSNNNGGSELVASEPMQILSANPDSKKAELDVTWSPSAAYLASGGADEKVHVWTVRDKGSGLVDVDSLQVGSMS